MKTHRTSLASPNSLPHRRSIGVGHSIQTALLRASILCVVMSCSSTFAQEAAASFQPRGPVVPNDPAHPVGVVRSAVTPNFSLQVLPAQITIAAGARGTVAIVASPKNGFSGNVTLTVGGLPKGVTASPSKITVKAGTLSQFTITATTTAKAGATSLTFAGVTKTLSHTATARLTVTAAKPVTSASLSATAFSFGNNLVGNSVSHVVSVVTNTGKGWLTMAPKITGNPGFTLVAAGSCGAQLAPGASCHVVVKYLPATASSPKEQSATVNMGFAGVPADTPQQIGVTGTSATVAAGQVTGTDNTQVALYTMTLPFPGKMTVQFGQSTTYGHSTWSQSTDTDGGMVQIFVAGMLGSTAYHMQATVVFDNGLVYHDMDHTFTTGAPPASMALTTTTNTPAGMTPQPGLELLNPLSGVVITDLSGNPLWVYQNPGANTAINFVDGVKMLPNGDVLLDIGPTSEAPLNTPTPANAVVEIREVNLGGDTVREITLNDLNWELQNSTCQECNVQLVNFHHDITPLPNGHWIVLANAIMTLSSSTTPPLTSSSPVAVIGDVIVDLDENLHPVWAWNEFNHLDPNRHPEEFPDWTHTNAVVYSPDDGNLIVSIRHQNWVIKVDYANGTGAGDILWRLGEGGDFTLVNGVDPTDWNNAQHGPAFFSNNTSGVFSLGMMDNGDWRPFAVGVTCGTTGNPPCLYSTVPIYQIDETAKTATLTFHQIAPTTPVNEYNSFGGNVTWLANGNVEYDLCGTSTGSYVYEVTRTASPQTVWTMHVSNTNLYRASRIESMYPNTPY